MSTVGLSGTFSVLLPCSSQRLCQKLWGLIGGTSPFLPKPNWGYWDKTHSKDRREFTQWSNYTTGSVDSVTHQSQQSCKFYRKHLSGHWSKWWFSHCQPFRDPTAVLYLDSQGIFANMASKNTQDKLWDKPVHLANFWISALLERFSQDLAIGARRSQVSKFSWKHPKRGMKQTQLTQNLEQGGESTEIQFCCTRHKV